MIIMDTHIWLWWVNEDPGLLGQVRNGKSGTSINK